MFVKGQRCSLLRMMTFILTFSAFFGVYWKSLELLCLFLEVIEVVVNIHITKFYYISTIN